jgi:hypothetical protein
MAPIVKPIGKYDINPPSAAAAATGAAEACAPSIFYFITLFAKEINFFLICPKENHFNISFPFACGDAAVVCACVVLTTIGVA